MMRNKLILILIVFLLIVTGVFMSYEKVVHREVDKPIHWDSELSPNGLYRGDSYTYDYKDRYTYYRVFITNLRTGKTKKVYSGDHRTQGWKWTKNNGIKIELDCGTGCLVSKTIGINDYESFSSYGKGKMNEKNGWTVQYFKSF